MSLILLQYKLWQFEKTPLDNTIVQNIQNSWMDILKSSQPKEQIVLQCSSMIDNICNLRKTDEEHRLKLVSSLCDMYYLCNATTLPLPCMSALSTSARNGDLVLVKFFVNMSMLVPNVM